MFFKLSRTRGVRNWNRSDRIDQTTYTMEAAQRVVLGARFLSSFRSFCRVGGSFRSGQNSGIHPTKSGKSNIRCERIRTIYRLFPQCYSRNRTLPSRFGETWMIGDGSVRHNGTYCLGLFDTHTGQLFRNLPNSLTSSCPRTVCQLARQYPLCGKCTYSHRPRAPQWDYRSRWRAGRVPPPDNHR